MLRKYLFVPFFIFSFVVHASTLPLFPVPFKDGTGVLIDDVIYAGLGSAGTKWYKFDTRKDATTHSWHSLPPFPDGPRNQATAIYINGGIYIFGGISKDEKGRSYVCNDIHRFDPVKNVWETLDSHSPVGLAGHVTFINHNKVFVTGGVNQTIYNDYIKAIVAAGNDTMRAQHINQAYFSKKTEDYLFNKTLFSFDPMSEQWHYESESPSGGTAGTVAITDGDDTYLLNGEQKPGLRTDSVLRLTVTEGNIHWDRVPTVSSPDGTAGAFGATSQGLLIYAGGAVFKGARKNYNEGKYYAHKGLSKSYSDVVHVFREGKWDEMAKLPQGRAYGVSLPWHDGLLILGGETDGGKTLSDSLWIRFNKDKAVITQ